MAENELRYSYGLLAPLFRDASPSVIEVIALMGVKVIGNLEESHGVEFEFSFQRAWGAQRFHFGMGSIRRVKLLAAHKTEHNEALTREHTDIPVVV